jgi:hypothetical protein
MKKRNEVVLLATIDYTSSERRQGRELRPNTDSPDRRIEEEARRAIETDLPNDLQRIYGLDIRTHVLDVQSGSLLVFFSAVISGLSLFSSYAGFFDSVKLIKRHCDLLLTRLLQNYPGDFDVNVVEMFPTLPDPSDFSPWRRLRKMFGPEIDFWPGAPFGNRQRIQRDAFFWFLLIFNVLLVAALATLVTGAVIKTYFR